MSLLLEALKKAEKAKEDAQRRARDASAGPEPEASIFDTEATVATDGRHIMRRDELPDISAPLEILSEDLRPSAPKATPPLELMATEDPAPERAAAQRRAPPRAPASAQQATDPSNSERVAAQKVFEAKFREPNPRLPFYLTMGLLGSFAVGTAIYFYIQLRPPPSLINTNPVRSANEKPVEPTADKGAASATAAAPQSAGPGAIPGLPGGPAPASAPPVAAVVPPAAPAAPAAAASAPAPAVSASAPKAATASTPRPAAGSSDAARSRAAAKDEERPLSVTRSGSQIHPQVATGYSAYQAGDLAKARTEYQQVLREEPSNKDALLEIGRASCRERVFVGV